MLRVWQLGFLHPGPDLTWLGRDFRIYRNAAVALLGGGDPYAAFDQWNGTAWHFAALPSAAHLFVPFAILPEGIGLAIFLALGVGLTLVMLRRLRLPWWWLLFPPMAEGIGAANPHVVLLPLLVLGLAAGRTGQAAGQTGLAAGQTGQAAGQTGLAAERTGPAVGRTGSAVGRARPGPAPGAAVATMAARALAVGLKIYAIAPVVARREWRAVAGAVALTAASVALAPGLWLDYARRFGELSGRLAQEAVGGLSATLLLDPGSFGTLLGTNQSVARIAGIALFVVVVVLVGAAAVRDVPSAGWLAVPLLWPAGQYPYATFAIPIARRLSTWILAIPLLPTYLIGLLVLAWEVVARRPALVPQEPPIGLVDWVRSILRPTPGAPQAGELAVDASAVDAPRASSRLSTPGSQPSSGDPGAAEPGAGAAPAVDAGGAGHELHVHEVAPEGGDIRVVERQEGVDLLLRVVAVLREAPIQQPAQDDAPLALLGRDRHQALAVEEGAQHSRLLAIEPVGALRRRRRGLRCPRFERIERPSDFAEPLGPERPFDVRASGARLDEARHPEALEVVGNRRLPELKQASQLLPGERPVREGAEDPEPGGIGECLERSEEILVHGPSVAPGSIAVKPGRDATPTRVRCPRCLACLACLVSPSRAPRFPRPMDRCLGRPCPTVVRWVPTSPWGRGSSKPPSAPTRSAPTRSSCSRTTRRHGAAARTCRPTCPCSARGSQS